ncbi:MAG TPA: hypothetical protein VGO52_27415 [Hyphomonadaceae bacterium]|nr:hypothetical protein [Hyphomonadaceae bacterium]
MRNGSSEHQHSAVFAPQPKLAPHFSQVLGGRVVMAAALAA